MLKRFKHHFQSIRDVVLFVHIFCWISFFSLLLKVVSFSILMEWISPFRTKISGSTEAEKRLFLKVPAYTDFILRRNWWIYRPNCLKRSLVICRFFRHYGINVKICMGIRKNSDLHNDSINEYLQGHAWLILDGNPVFENIGAVETVYTPVFSFPR